MSMRTTRFGIVVVLWLVASQANAQPPNTPPPQVEEDTGLSILAHLRKVDFGVRGTAFVDTTDRARYERYRDLRNGPFVEGFRWGNDSDHALWNVRATHVGYRDQQYVANYNHFGKVKASFEWNQIPLFFSETTRTAFTEEDSGVLRLGDLPRLVQTGAATTAIYNTQASPFDLRLKRGIADVRLVYSATKNLDVGLTFKNTQKEGQQPWAGTFGFADAVELPVPVDTRTTDVGAAAEWTGDRGQVRVGYDGTFFNNNVDTITWDNPLRFADSPTAGPAHGRMSLWPNSTVNAGSVSGLVKLPRSSQATAYVSLGNWSQDAALIPFTINPALLSIPLDRPSADASARVTATAFTYNIRPAPRLWLNARFRSYDFDNRTPVFTVPTTVSYDTTVAAFAEGGTSPYSFTRKVLDLDASWTPIAFAAFRAGYTRETVDQNFRFLDQTTENTLRLSADATGLQWLTVRAVYEHGKRVGSGFDEQTLDDIGEQVSLRQFDISDRTTNRFSTIVIATPMASFSVNANAFVGREDRPGAVFGLRSNDNNGVGVGFDYVPGDVVSVGAAYQFEKYKALQASRQANPGAQFDDPTRDWTTDSADRAHTVTFSADLPKVWKKTNVRFAYDMSRARSVYVYGLAPNTTLPPVAQLPPVVNSRNRFTADGTYMVTRHLGAGLVYWYEKYSVQDYAFSPATLNTISLPSFVAIGYMYQPYTANTVWARLTYLW
jgi:MtrB/PioB family decaheme-associated outer membrane protein